MATKAVTPSDSAQSRKLIVKTAAYTVKRDECPCVLSNEAATGAVIITLPQDARGGEVITLVCDANQTFTANPGTAGAVIIGGSKLADDLDVSISKIGDSITLIANGDGDWVLGETLPIFQATYSMNANGSIADQAFFVATRPCRVLSVSEVHSAAGTDAGAVNVQVVKDTSTNAPGAGTDLLTNNTNAGFDLKGTANTVQNGTLAATAGLMTLAAGDRLAVDFAGVLTTLAGVNVTVLLTPVTWD